MSGFQFGRPVGELLLQMPRDVRGHHRAADPARLEGALLLVERADDAALIVVEHRAVDGAGNVVDRELGRRARIDERIEAMAVAHAHRVAHQRPPDFFARWSRSTATSATPSTSANQPTT